MPRHRERPPLRLRPGVSRRLAVFVAGAHLLAMGVISLLPLAVILRGAMVAVVLLSLVYAFADRVLYRLPWSLREAVWRADGRWSLTLASGREREGRLLASTYVSPTLVVLRFRCGRLRTCSLLLLPDNLDPDRLRRLRVRLRLTGRKASENSSGFPWSPR